MIDAIFKFNFCWVTIGFRHNAMKTVIMLFVLIIGTTHPHVRAADIANKIAEKTAKIETTELTLKELKIELEKLRIDYANALEKKTTLFLETLKPDNPQAAEAELKKSKILVRTLEKRLNKLEHSVIKNEKKIAAMKTGLEKLLVKASQDLPPAIPETEAIRQTPPQPDKAPVQAATSSPQKAASETDKSPEDAVANKLIKEQEKLEKEQRKLALKEAKAEEKLEKKRQKEQENAQKVAAKLAAQQTKINAAPEPPKTDLIEQKNLAEKERKLQEKLDKEQRKLALKEAKAREKLEKKRQKEQENARKIAAKEAAKLAKLMDTPSTMTASQPARPADTSSPSSKMNEKAKTTAVPSQPPGSMRYTDKILVIDDFNSAITANNFNNKTNTYERDPSTAYINFVTDNVSGNDSGVLKLTFDKKNEGGPNGQGGWCGYYSILRDPNTNDYLDVSELKYISFSLKGANGAENFVIGLADQHWEKLEDSIKSNQIISYLNQDQLGTKWQKVRIPLSEFKLDLTKVASIAICFESYCFPNGAGQGTVFIDDLAFEK